MNQMIVLVLNDLNLCPSVLDAWEAAGARGITILESSGLARMRNKEKSAFRDDLPLMPSLSSIFKGQETNHRTFFTVVDNHELVDKIIDATQAITGSLDQPNTGIIFVLPVSRVVGLSGKPTEQP